jgi:alkanesulfonate monooxygenase SsuD/methylene tetrahydromethanopterin reductase-like flavin-dependent oxidoreductase (luciferase family)
MNRIGIRYDPRAANDSHASLVDDASASETHDTKAPAAGYAAILDHAAMAERCGVDVLWVAERPFVRGALLPAALPLCAALAERTERVRIATGALPLPLHHPLRVAEDGATVDVVSGGRFELGVGLGEHAEGFDGFGVPIRERADRFEEALDWVRRAWTEETVCGSGGHFEIAEVAVYPRPIQKPHPPLWIAAQAEAAVRRAARLETGLLTDSLDAARRFLAAWAEEGRSRDDARVAWYIDPGDASQGEFEERVAAGLSLLAGANVDIVVPARVGDPSEGHPDLGSGGLAGRVAALRSIFAG